MKVSVVIPSYKPQDYLWECLDSIRCQTLPMEDYEVIVVLNGCCEPYKTQIEKYVDRHSMTNLRLIQTDEGGVSRARNTGIEAARGEYIAFVDDDDYVSDSYLQAMIDIARDGVTPVTNVIAFDSETRDVVPNYLTNRFKKMAGCGAVSLFAGKSFMSVPVAKILHRDVIGDRRFDTRFVVNEDCLFMFEISRYMHRLQATPDTAVYYRRVRSTSASMRRRTRREMLGLVYEAIAAFTRIYFKGFPHYNLPLYLSRVAAKLRQAVIS